MKFTYTLSIFLLIPFCWGFSQNIFTDVTQEAALISYSGGQSIAVGDFNNDGFDDLYVGFANQKNQLWKNKGDGTFEELAANAGVDLEMDIDTKTAIWGDINNDGYLDLYVGNREVADQLFLNNGDETFTDISSMAGTNQIGDPFSVNMADVNNDGFLDIYASNFSMENVLYVNNGDGTFSDKTQASGALDSGKSMASIFFDYDKDGDADLYLLHDGMEPNFLYQNDGTGVFSDVGAAAGVNTESFGMGVDVGDINKDGWLDIYFTNLYKNILLLNNADGTFTNISENAAVEDFGMGWGTSFLDFDNDSHLDIYVANDYYFSPFPNVLYHNMGDLTFEKVDVAGPIANQYESYAAVCLDYNQDGFMDIAVANKASGEQMQLFENMLDEGAWMGFKLIGVESNRQAAGAKIQLEDNLGNIYYDELTLGNSWTAQNSSLFHFGLGTATSIEAITVYWPSGLEQNFTDLALDKFYTIVEGEAPEEGILNGMTTSVEEFVVKVGLEVTIYPNPSQGDFTIQFNSSSSSPTQLKVEDPLGRLLHFEEWEGMPHNGTISIDLGNQLSSNFLIVSVSSEEETIVQKLMVTKRD